jgi:hypothetical protein
MASDGRYAFAAVSDVGRQPGGIGGAAGLGNAPLHPTQGGGLTALTSSTAPRRGWPGTPCAPPRNGCSPAQPAAVTAIPASCSPARWTVTCARSRRPTVAALDVDTAKPYTTTNGVPGTGGRSTARSRRGWRHAVRELGYPRFGGMPGNVLWPSRPRVSARSAACADDFTPQQKENANFIAAAEEYQRIWADEGERVIRAMEQVTRLEFPEKEVAAEIYEGPSFSGRGSLPMRLRASYPFEIKKGTLVHEMGHRMNGQLRRRRRSSTSTACCSCSSTTLGAVVREGIRGHGSGVRAHAQGLYDYDAVDLGTGHDAAAARGHVRRRRQVQSEVRAPEGRLKAASTTVSRSSRRRRRRRRRRTRQPGLA